MKKKKTIVMIGIAVCVVLICAIVGINVFANRNKDIICNGVYVNTVDLSGMTKEEAIQALSQYMETVGKKQITVLVDENQVKVPVTELGIDAHIEKVVEEAFAIGKSGNFMKRYKDIKALENETLVLPMPLTLDSGLVKKFVEEKCSVYDIKEKNADISRENGMFVVTDHMVGKKVDVAATTKRIEDTLCKEWNLQDAVVDAVISEIEPEYTKETLLLCKDILGTFSTTYKTSSQSRANNLANGAKLINGSVVWPGEVFSTGKTMQPITVKNGYSIAGAYENGQVVDSVGGGVCQVATTLYNALLKAELEVTDRSNHSMIVGYVKPSMDAAIAGDYKDLKFKNNTDVPIYIEATTVGRTITFTIYGHETRDIEHRVVSYESKVLKVIQPGKEKITEDETLPTSYRKVTQSAHVGYKAELWKVIHENGVEVGRERVNYSSYSAEPAYVIVGTKEEEEEEEKEETKDKEKEKEDEEKEEKETESPKPDATHSPSVVQSPSPSPVVSSNPKVEKTEDISEE